MLGLVALILLIAGFLVPAADQAGIAATLGFPVGLVFAFVCLYKIAHFFLAPSTERVKHWS